MVDVKVHEDLKGARFVIVPIRDMDTSHLGPTERAYYDNLKATLQRRREWLAGRRAAKAVLGDLGFADVEVLRQPSGAPRPTVDGVHLAIAHGKRMAAAIATKRVSPYPHVGIDIVDLEDVPRIQRIANRALTDEERTRAKNDPRHAQLAWAAREAVAKATSTGMFVFALSQCWTTGVDPVANRVETNLEGVRVVYEPLEDGGILVLAGATNAAFSAAQRAAR